MTSNSSIPQPQSESKSQVEQDIDEIEKDCVEQLRVLIKDDPDLPSLYASLSEPFLLLIIRARRNRPQVSLKLIKTLITFKTTQYPTLFSELNASSILPVMDNKMIQIVHRPDGYECPAVIVFKTAQWNTSLASFDKLIQAGFLYALQTITTSNAIQERAGIILVLDMSGFGFSHARECSYSNVTKMANCIIFGSPFRINCAFLINSPYIFEKVYSVVKYAVPEFYRNFITVTTDDFTKLHSLVGRRYLPESLKGFVPESEGWEQNLEDGIKNGQNGIQLVQELLSAVEQHSNNSNDNDKK